jgi:hypothetical protein
MKKSLFLLLFSALAFTASAQLPSLTNGTVFRATKGNETWLTTLADIVAFVNAGTGTVTSVDVSGGTTGLTTTGGPITTSGTITVAGTLDVDNGGTGQTSYTNGQLLIGNTTGNTLTKATLTEGEAIDISNGSGSITILAEDATSSNKGVATFNTANFTVTAGDVAVATNGIANSNIRQSAGLSVIGRSGNTTGNVDDITAAADGDVLRVSGTTLGFGDVSLTTGVTGTLPVGNGGTGLTAVGGDGTIIGSNGTANVYLNPTITTTAAAIAYTRNGSNLELNLPNADASNRGTVSTGTQTFAGAKTFSAQVTASSGVTATATASTPALFATGVAGGDWTAYTATATLDESDNLVEIGTLASAATFNLPACNATRNGWEYHFVKVGSDTNGATIDPNGSETFTDTATTKTMYSQGNTATCKCRWNGSAGTWFFIQ